MTHLLHSPQVLVIGAGPAGAMAGLRLARLGVDVLLVDKADWPRNKVCGGCLNAAALAALEDVDAGDLVRRAGGQPLSTLQVAVGNRHVSVDLPRSVAVSRRRLDAAMIERFVESGGSFAPSTLARVVSVDPAVAELRSATGRRTVRPRVIIVADGLAGRSAATTTLPEPGSRMGAGVIIAHGGRGYESGKIYMAVGRGGYVGLVRLGGESVDIAAAFDLDFVRESGSPGAAAEILLHDVGMPPIAQITEASWRGTPLLTRRRVEVARGAMFTVGDAAGYVEPFTGQGIAWAFRSAAALAPIAAAAVGGVDETHRSDWRRAHLYVTAAQHRRCRLLARGLRSPLMTGAMIAMLKAIPALRRPAVRWLAGGAGMDSAGGAA